MAPEYFDDERGGTDTEARAKRQETRAMVEEERAQRLEKDGMLMQVIILAWRGASTLWFLAAAAWENAGENDKAEKAVRRAENAAAEADRRKLLH